MQILEAAVPEADFSVGDNGKSLVVSAPTAEFKKVANALDSLLKGPSNVPIVPTSDYSASRVGPVRASYPRYGPSTGPAAGPWYYGGPATRGGEPADLEMLKLEDADANAGKRVVEIVKEYKSAAEQEDQDEARSKLKQAVIEHFAVRQSRREHEVARLEARLEKVRQSITKRSELQDQIVDRHVSELLGERDDLAF